MKSYCDIMVELLEWTVTIYVHWCSKQNKIAKLWHYAIFFGCRFNLTGLFSCTGLID